MRVCAIPRLASSRRTVDGVAADYQPPTRRLRPFTRARKERLERSLAARELSRDLDRSAPTRERVAGRDDHRPRSVIWAAARRPNAAELNKQRVF